MSEDWVDGLADDSDDLQVEEYDLTSSPNDFNTTTIYNFIESGAVKIPGFQRNYVWDIKRASKLIESLVIGLPVPQIFLYEEDRNTFLVIDGQQRLMTVYFFVKQRFPKMEKRSELRRIITEHGVIPDSMLHDDEFFANFNLRLPKLPSGAENQFARLNYSTLGEYKTQFDLRTIRNVIVKQVSPSDDDSSIYEMFHRLNTGGMNLSPQEIRASLYHSKFYDMLFDLNLDPRWRALLGTPQPDLRSRDIEILLRGIGLSREVDEYRPSMVRFLNAFSKEAQRYSEKKVEKIRQTVEWFLEMTEELPRTTLQTRQGKFSVPLFEAVFAALTRLKAEGRMRDAISHDVIVSMKTNKEFLRHSQEQTTTTSNVKGRVNAALRLLEAV